jgi:hypothetical protein
LARERGAAQILRFDRGEKVIRRYGSNGLRATRVAAVADIIDYLLSDAVEAVGRAVVPAYRAAACHVLRPPAEALLGPHRSMSCSRSLLAGGGQLCTRTK